MSKKSQYIYPTHSALIKDLKIQEQPLTELVSIIQDTYCDDNRPWIIGFSGGKDSTAILSLIYYALLTLSKENRKKHIYVVSSDTLVETPVVIDLINSVLDSINRNALKDEIPMSGHPVYPEMDQTFWTNLLGRGYPAPRQSFRWCTERMKIDPVSSFITSRVAEFGEVVVVLGSRREESASRAQVIAKHSIKDSKLSRHTSLPNAYTYMPIESWTADDVWQYLMSAPCPWGGNNQKLFDLYKGSNQGECPLVIDTSTPSCGNSRFGCWTCTVVNEDKALHGLIESGETWMQPLLDFRNELYESTKPASKTAYRHYKRRTGFVQYTNNDENNDQKHIPGPYWIKQRQEWMKKLLTIEKKINNSGHKISLIKQGELHAIRQHWLRDPNEPDWADSLPKIYSEVYNDQIDWVENDAGAFTEPDAKLLNKLGIRHSVSAEMIMKLIEVELSMSGLQKRTGIFTKLETVLKKDWESLEEINSRNLKSDLNNPWEEKLKQLQEEYDKVCVL